MAPSLLESNSTHSTAESRSSNVEPHALHDDERSCQSDCSVGEVTQSSVSEGTRSDRPLISAVAASLSEKQQDISLAFASMVTKMAQMIEDKEAENEKLLGQFSPESQQKRQEQAEKCTKAVNAMAKKQAKIACQFENLILELEESNRQNDLERIQLKKQVAQMRERMQKMKLSIDRSGGKRNFSKPPGIPNRFRSSSGQHTYTPSVAETQATEAFSIKEISFSSTIVDVAEVRKTLNADSGTMSSLAEEHPAAGENVRFLL